MTTGGDYTGGIANAQPGGATTAPGATVDPPVFMGGFHEVSYQNQGTGAEGNLHPIQQKYQAGNTLTQSQAMNLWYSWSQAQQMAWTKKAYALGYISSPTDVMSAESLWMKVAVPEAVMYFQAGRTVSPWDVLDINAGSNADTLKKRAASGPGGITTTKQVNLTDKLGVQAIATQVLQQALGRDPTSAEVNTYYNTIRGEEQMHPTITTTKSDGYGSSISTTSGGFSQADAQQALLNKIQNDPEFAKYQAGTTYFQAAMAANAAIGGA